MFLNLKKKRSKKLKRLEKLIIGGFNVQNESISEIKRAEYSGNYLNLINFVINLSKDMDISKMSVMDIHNLYNKR